MISLCVFLIEDEIGFLIRICLFDVSVVVVVVKWCIVGLVIVIILILVSMCLSVLKVLVLCLLVSVLVFLRFGLKMFISLVWVWVVYLEVWKLLNIFVLMILVLRFLFFMI